MKKLIVAIAAGVAAMGAAQAQSTATEIIAQPTHPYVGVAVSGSKNQASDDWKASPKVFAGYDLTPNWGVEAGYTRFRKEGYNTVVAPNTVAGANVRGSSSYVAAKFMTPVNERVSAYAKLGASYNERKARINGFSDNTERDTSAYGALGAQYAFNQNVSLVGEYERYGKDKYQGAKADAVSLGLKYGF